MAAKGFSLAEQFSRWEVLVSNLKESAALPHVTEELGQLETLLAQVRAIQVRQEHFRAQSQEITAELRQLARQGRSIRGRLGANLQGKFGFDSETLVRYGFKPRRPPRRRPKAETPPQVTAAATTAATAVAPANTKS